MLKNIFNIYIYIYINFSLNPCGSYFIHFFIKEEVDFFVILDLKSIIQLFSFLYMSSFLIKWFILY